MLCSWGVQLMSSCQGTTLLYLATDAFKAYASAVGATMDSTTGLLTITPAQYARLQPLNFEIGSAGTLTLPPNGQIWPRSLNAQIGGNSSFIYLIVNDVSMRASPSSAVC
jgi:saccharopepsin